MADVVIARSYPNWHPDGIISDGGFHFATQPFGNGSAALLRGKSNATQDPNFWLFGSQKTTFLKRTAWCRFNLNKLSPSDEKPANSPPTGADLSLARILVTASAVDTGALDALISIVAPDGRWDDGEVTTASRVGVGADASGFRVRDSALAPIDGPGATSAETEVQIRRFGILDIEEAGASFGVASSQTFLREVTFRLRRPNVAMAGDNVQALLFQCAADDGSDDSASGAAFASSSLVPVDGNIGTAVGPVIFQFAPFVPLTQGRRFCILVVGDWTGDGSKFVGMEVSDYAGTPSGYSGQLVIGDPTSAIARGFLPVNYPTNYDFPHTHDDAGLALAGTVRTRSPDIDRTWVAPLHGPIRQAAPPFTTVGVEFAFDVTALMKPFIADPSYTGGIGGPDPNSVAFAFATDEASDDLERESVDMRLELSWVAADGVCAEGDLDVTRRALGTASTTRRAEGQAETTRRALGTASTTIRAEGQIEVTRRALGTLEVCPKD